MIHIHRTLSSSAIRPFFILRSLSTKSTKHGDDEWNNAWESAWLPDDLSSKNRAPWETDVNFSLSSDNNQNPSLVLPTDVDAETKAFVEDMADNWEQRRKSPKFQQQQQQQQKDQSSLYSLENVKKDYRLTKQRVHAGLWMKEIEKQEEAKLGDSILGGSDDIERLLDSCSEIFDSADNNVNSKVPSGDELKNKPDGWESTSKAQDGNIWEMSQREEDILLQEFEGRIAFCKFQMQIASFIKTHIFSRRRPIDGWRYMIEELGPNARKGKGSVSPENGAIERAGKSPLLCFMFITPVSSLGQKLKIWLPYIFPEHYSILSSDQELVSLLKSCNHTSEIAQGHASMVKTGLDLIPFTLSKLLASSIMDMGYAASIFRHIINPNLFMFNTILRGYSSSDDPKRALVLFNYTRDLNIMLDQFTFISTLKSCAHLSATGTGLGIHCIVLQFGYDLFLFVRNTLLHFYCVLGRTGDAHKLFDDFPQERDLVSWNTLMGGYLHESQPAIVLDLFRQLSGDGLNVGATTLLSALSAIGDLGDTLGGESLHGYCMKTGFYLDLNVVTALTSVYCKTGQIESGRRVFDEVSVKDVVLWNCLMDDYAKSGLLEESLALLKLMKLERVRPNSSTMGGLLSSCASSGALIVGQCIHNYLEEEQLALDAILGTALVDMYSKCGLLTKAVNVFNRMKTRDVKLGRP